jgi:hypothetical protein
VTVRSAHNTPAAQVLGMVASFASVLALLIADALAGSVATASADPAVVAIGPAIDVSAARFWGGDVRSGGQASRIELDDVELTATLSAWYRLAAVDGGTRLRVFERYPAAVADPDADIMASANMAWRLANKVAGPAGDSLASNQLPRWAQFRTANDTGASGGLMFTLAYIDVLTPGALVGTLRVAGSGGIGPDGVVFPVSNLEIKVAAAMLTRPDVVFTTRPPKQVEHVTIVDAQPSRHPTSESTVGEWLNLIGYEQAGRIAASHSGTAVVVVVHDLRQALAWLCGRTERAIACAIASRSATIPIGTP